MNAIFHISFAMLLRFSECARLSNAARIKGGPNRFQQSCKHPLHVGIKNFSKQCAGNCKRVPHRQEALERSWVPQLLNDTVNDGWSLVDRRFREKYRCVARPISAYDLWTPQSFYDPPERRMGFNDRQLLEAMSLSVQVSVFEAASEESDLLINATEEDDRESRERSLDVAYGTGTSRMFEGHVVNGVSRSFAASSLRGKHAANEDASWWLDLPDIAAFSVFDGHDGPDASDESAHMFLHKMPVLWLTHLRNADIRSDFWVESLRDVFSETHQQLLSPKLRGGTTASVILANKSSGATVVAWVGDTQVMHARPDQQGGWHLHWLSKEHQCAVDADWINITANNEEINCKLVSGSKPRACKGRSCVGVTRALGDRHQFNDGLLLSVPEIHELNVETGDILLAASDGIWDAVEVADVLDALLLDIHDAVQHLVRKAQAAWKEKHIHYQDDITVVLWRADLGLDANKLGADYHVSESSGAWLLDGGLGDRCEQLKTMSFMHQFGQGLRRNLNIGITKDSTCGKMWPVAYQMANGNTRHYEEQLSCYLPSSAKHPKKGDFGVCALGALQACGEYPHGCREGTRCLPIPEFEEGGKSQILQYTFECIPMPE